jgi:predicted TIM-barrel fold metal-dependent hydrolase
MAADIEAAPAQPMTPVNFEVPPHACDCHTHIVADPAKFPLSPARTYTPEPASPAQMLALHKALHVERVVIVTPSIYATDNSATLYGLKARGATARAVVVIDDHTPDADLDAMHKAGARGIRLNLLQGGQVAPAQVRDRFERAAARMKTRGWHIQIFTSLASIAGIKDLVASSPVPVVFDHFGGAGAALGTGQPGFADLVALIRSGKAYVKISAPYRASTQGPDYPDVRPLAKAYIEANPERILWGTDWPHPDTAARAGVKATDVRPPLRVDDGRVLNQLAIWAPDPAVRNKILVDNPAHLYAF